MTKFICSQHGTIRYTGNIRPKYCPVCKSEVYPIFPIPRIYVDKNTAGVCLAIVCILIVASSITYFIMSYGNGKADAFNEMSSDWKPLYRVMATGYSSNLEEYVAFKRFIKDNEERLKTIQPLTDKDLKALEYVVDARMIFEDLASYQTNSKKEK